jgi:DNA invertase Pin-like site-specific DNA recombinase
MKRERQDPPRTVGYVRVSTVDQGESGAGLSAQRQAIERECQHRGWPLLEVYEDVASGKSINSRHRLKAALEELTAGRADCLMAAKLDRVSRSTVDFGLLLERARREDWAVVVLDLGLDMSTAMGELMANMAISIAQFERRRGGERTKEGLAERRKAGIVLGRPPQIDPRTEGWVHWRHRQGASIRQIIVELQEQGQPAPRGGQWQVSTIQRILARDPGRPRVARPQTKAS